MSQPEAQGVTSREYQNIGELLAEAENHIQKKEQPEQSAAVEEKKGLEFMSVRYNIVEKKRELAKYITFHEYRLLEEIIIATLGAQNGQKTWMSKTEVFIKDLAALTGLRSDVVYKALKLLQHRELIIREKTRSRGRDIIGLNPEKWGQVLTDYQTNEEKKRHLHLAVDNSKSSDKNHGKVRQESCLNKTQNMSNTDTNHDKTSSQVHEIIDEKSPLDSSRSYLDSSRLQNRGEFHSQQGGSGNQKPRLKTCPFCGNQIAPRQNLCGKLSCQKEAMQRELDSA